MRHLRHDNDPVVITDAEPSLADEQRIRKRVYTILMVIHLIGFAAAGLLAHVWWLAISLVILTGPLPWVAVVIANNRMIGNEMARRWQRESRTSRKRDDELDRGD